MGFLAIRQSMDGSIRPLAMSLSENAALKFIADKASAYQKANPKSKISVNNCVFTFIDSKTSQAIFRVIPIKLV